MYRSNGANQRAIVQLEMICNNFPSAIEVNWQFRLFIPERNSLQKKKNDTPTDVKCLPKSPKEIFIFPIVSKERSRVGDYDHRAREETLSVARKVDAIAPVCTEAHKHAAMICIDKENIVVVAHRMMRGLPEKNYQVQHKPQAFPVTLFPPFSPISIN